MHSSRNDFKNSIHETLEIGCYVSFWRCLLVYQWVAKPVNKWLRKSRAAMSSTNLFMMQFPMPFLCRRKKIYASQCFPSFPLFATTHYFWNRNHAHLDLLIFHDSFLIRIFVRFQLKCYADTEEIYILTLISLFHGDLMYVLCMYGNDYANVH